jgi:hypothetical protein
MATRGRKYSINIESYVEQVLVKELRVGQLVSNE